MLGKNLTVDRMLKYDEYYTLERSVGFEKFDDWLSVYSRNAKTAKKPPLQYWLTGLSIKLGMDNLRALRIWSVVFYIGLLATAGWLAARVSRNVWSAPAAMLFLLSSPLLLSLARSGMLDIGMSFFLVLALLFFFEALNKPKLWFACAIAIGLGALQKAPIAILMLAIVILSQHLTSNSAFAWKNLKRQPFFKNGLISAIGLVLAWPLIQTFNYGSRYFKEAYQKEMFRRFKPSGDEWGKEDGPWVWLDWLWSDWGYLAIIALTAIVLVFAIPRFRRDFWLIGLASCVAVILISFSFAKGSIYMRYLAVVLPMISIILCAVLSNFERARFLPALLASAFLIASWPNLTRVYSDNFDGGATKYNHDKVESYIVAIDGVLEAHDHLIIDRTLVPAGAYGYFGKTTQEALVLKLSRDSHAKEFKKRVSAFSEDTANLYGLIATDNIHTLQATGKPYVIVKDLGDVKVWKLL